jgi:arylsulfatase A-like enzyme
VLPALMGTGPAPSPDRHLYWEFHENGFQQAVRWRDWKAVRDRLQGPVEIYNLAKDPSEQNNLAAKEPEIARHMIKLLDTSRTNPDLWTPKVRPPKQTGE